MTGALPATQHHERPLSRADRRIAVARVAELRGRLAVYALSLDVATVDEELSDEDLAPAERRLAGSRKGRRLSDFRLGRVAAHRAITAAGGERGVVLERNGIPVFPEGIVGSISHSHGLAVALVTTTAAAVAVGVDVEARPVSEAMARIVASQSELKWVLTNPAERRASALFCSKESAVKALCSMGMRVSLPQIRLVPTGSHSFEIAHPSLTPGLTHVVEWHSMAQWVVAWSVVIHHR